MPKVSAGVCLLVVLGASCGGRSGLLDWAGTRDTPEDHGGEPTLANGGTGDRQGSGGQQGQAGLDRGGGGGSAGAFGTAGEGGSPEMMSGGASGEGGTGGNSDVGGVGGAAGAAGAAGAPDTALQLSLGAYFNFALLPDSTLRTWGANNYGQLGLGNLVSIGDDELPSSVGAVDVGGTPLSVDAGCFHSCALFEGGKVRCWGLGTGGRLGYGNTKSIGDDEAPASAGYLDLGGEVSELAVGCYSSCALMKGGTVRCWGYGSKGALGYGNVNDIGDDETPASAGDVDLGGIVTKIGPGDLHSCAILQGGTVRCWGWGYYGDLGYGNANDIGDNETPASAGNVDVGGKAIKVAAGVGHSCALLEGGTVRCWGLAENGQLGYGNVNRIGDTESPASAGDVDVGAPVIDLVAGGSYTCVLTDAHEVRCWGYLPSYGSSAFIGDNETPASAGSVDVGGPVAAIAGGVNHVCARLTSGSVRCWGYGAYGQLGYGNTLDIGDDETPASAGDVQVF